MRIIRPSIRNIVRVVGQPSFIESYERTSIYPKLTAYIEKWKVDIGDRVKKGDLLATLFVPEVVEDFGTKNATVKLDEERIDLARKLVEVAEADVQGAEARLVEAKAILGKYQAEVDRWDSQVKRIEREVERTAIAPQILLELTDQWKSSIAARMPPRQPSPRRKQICFPERLAWPRQRSMSPSLKPIWLSPPATRDE